MITRYLGIRTKRKLSAQELACSLEATLTSPKIAHVGRNTYCGTNFYCPNFKETTIGAFCSIGDNVELGHFIHPLSMLSTSPYFYTPHLKYKSTSTPSHEEYNALPPPIMVGNDVWIGRGAFIKNGLTLGDGCVIGARSVVTKDVPPYAIVAGNPARIIRYRFDEQTISKLLEIKWWEMDDDIIRNIPYDNIDKAIIFLEKQK